MNMQEPEEQRLEEQEPMEPAEDVSEFSDEPVLSDTDASETDEALASVVSSVDEADEVPVDEEPGEQPAGCQ